MQNTPSIRGRTRARQAILLGLVLGVSLGAVVALKARPATADRQALGPAGPMLDATHLPPLLTLPGESVELRYDIHCAAPADGSDEGTCAAGGTVHVRPGTTGPFRELSLALDRSASEGRYVARVPSDIARSSTGFTYYAVLNDGSGSGTTVTLPAGGAAAPHRSLPMSRPVLVALGRHAFGHARVADGRVAQAAWGNDPGQVGLEGGPNTAPIGGSSFDVDAAGNVLVLDEVGRRVLRWDKGASAPTSVPVAVDGTIGDLAVGPDDTLYVLEGARAGRSPVLRRFDPTGGDARAVELGERTATQVRIGSEGPLVLQQPSGQWRPAYTGGRAVDAAGQASAGTVGRPVTGGREVVVLRVGNEIRAALVQGGLVVRSWRVTSETPLAEIQLAEPFGAGLLLIARVYTDAQDEFRVLELGPRGLVGSASLDSADWAETAPLSRFRLAGSSLYQLGSTPAGLFVDRFDLEVK
jgi:hypothetical protein